MLLFYLLLIIAYLLGSLSSAIMVCRLMGLPDPRQHGSQNPGATNVLRISGKTAAGLVFLFDALKGFLPVIIAKGLGLTHTALSLVAVAAVLGHLWPIFFRFKGGKGVATTIGALFALSFPLAVLSAITWFATVAISRYVSLASLAAIAIALPACEFVSDPSYSLGLAMIFVLVSVRHLNNINRLLAGTERRLGSKDDH